MTEEHPEIRRKIANDFRAIYDEFQKTPPGKLRKISFPPEHKCRGMFAIFFAGQRDIISEEGVLQVHERTLEVLRKLNIVFHFIE